MPPTSFEDREGIGYETEKSTRISKIDGVFVYGSGGNHDYRVHDCAVALERGSFLLLLEWEFQRGICRNCELSFCFFRGHYISDLKTFGYFGAHRDGSFHVTGYVVRVFTISVAGAGAADFPFRVFQPGDASHDGDGTLVCVRVVIQRIAKRAFVGVGTGEFAARMVGGSQYCLVGIGNCTRVEGLRRDDDAVHDGDSCLAGQLV